jgi:translation elongation factor EF-Tu-like GTPase
MADFLMPVEDVFPGGVVTGGVERGQVAAVFPGRCHQYD